MNEQEKEFNNNYKLEFMLELECPKCGYDMKEWSNVWRCRNLDCRYRIEKKEKSNGK